MTKVRAAPPRGADPLNWLSTPGDKSYVNEYRVAARLHATSHVSEERFKKHLAALVLKLKRFAPEFVGFPLRYEVAIHALAASAKDAERLWWQEVEPVLESEHLGSSTSIYDSLPRAIAAARS